MTLTKLECVMMWHTFCWSLLFYPGSLSQEYIAANMKMHTKMAVNFTGNADVDFLLGMIPHHGIGIALSILFDGTVVYTEFCTKLCF